VPSGAQQMRHDRFAVLDDPSSQRIVVESSEGIGGLDFRQLIVRVPLVAGPIAVADLFNEVAPLVVAVVRSGVVFQQPV
jgi:hypothetical protein